MTARAAALDEIWAGLAEVFSAAGKGIESLAAIGETNPPTTTPIRTPPTRALSGVRLAIALGLAKLGVWGENSLVVEGLEVICGDIGLSASTDNEPAIVQKRLASIEMGFTPQARWSVSADYVASGASSVHNQEPRLFFRKKLALLGQTLSANATASTRRQAEIETGTGAQIVPTGQALFQINA